MAARATFSGINTKRGLARPVSQAPQPARPFADGTVLSGRLAERACHKQKFRYGLQGSAFDRRTLLVQAAQVRPRRHAGGTAGCLLISLRCPPHPKADLHHGLWIAG
jgi:hypothetical protein